VQATTPLAEVGSPVVEKIVTGVVARSGGVGGVVANIVEGLAGVILLVGGSAAVVAGPSKIAAGEIMLVLVVAILKLGVVIVGVVVIILFVGLVSLQAAKSKVNMSITNNPAKFLYFL
jgi:hypothetical protein